MAIAHICPSCQARLSVPESLAGKQVRCMQCRGISEVPQTSDADPFAFMTNAPKPATRQKSPAQASGQAPRDLPAGKAPPSSKRRKKKRHRESSFPWKWVLLGGGALAAVVAVGGLIYLVASGLGKWPEFESKEAHFRIATPRALNENTPPQLKAADASARMFMTEDSQNEAFGVIFVKIPEPRLASVSAVQILNDSCNGGLANSRGGTERYRQRLRRGPFEGMEMVIDVQDKGSKKGAAVFQAFLVKGRGYTLLAAGKKIEPDSERVRRFFESFVITDEPAFTGPIRRIGPQRNKSQPSSDGKPPPNEMQFLTRVDPMTSAVFAPTHHALLTVNETGVLMHYSYPGFRQVGRYRLANGVHRSVLDEPNGRLYVATYQKPPPAIHPSELKRPFGVGDIQIYDLKPVLANPRQDETPLRPAATVAVDGNISHLLLSPDAKHLYYLDIKNPVKPRLGVIDTANQRPSRTINVAANTEVICLTPKGDHLYAAATLCGHKFLHPAGTKLKGLVQIIDPGSGKTKQSFEVEEDPFDMAVTADERIVLTSGSNQIRPVTIVDLKDEGGPISEQVGSVYMNTYVRLSANGKRLYLGDTGVSPPSTQAWDMPALASLELKSRGVARGTPQQPAGGDFYLSPDDNCLICRTGAIYWNTKSAPPPRLEGK